MNRRHVLGALAAASLAGLLPAARAQNYPSRPVRMLVGFSAGGGVDALARAISDRLATQTGQNFVVDNRPGASSTIAANALVQSLSQQGFITNFRSGTELRAGMEDELERWTELIRKSGLVLK